MTLKVQMNQEAVLLELARRNMSQNMLADKTRLSTGYLSQLIRGIRYASPKVRQRLQSALEPMTFDDIFTVKEIGNGPKD